MLSVQTGSIFFFYCRKVCAMSSHITPGMPPAALTESENAFMGSSVCRNMVTKSAAKKAAMPLSAESTVYLSFSFFIE